MGFEKEASSSSYGLPSLPADEPSTGPLLAPHPSSLPPLSSQPKTFANVFIAIVGAGVLGLPYTFMRTGYLAGALMLIVIGALTYHCMMLIVDTRRRLDLDRGFSKIASFGDLGLAVAGPAGRLAVDSMIVLSQAGFCVGYLIFIANTLAHLYPFSPILGVLKPKVVSILSMLPFQLGLNSIKTLTLLAPLSIFADVVDIGAMGVVIVEDLLTYFHDRPDLVALNGGISVVLYGLGVAVYAFEGIGMVLPLESEAADKPKFGRTLGLSMGFISIMYALFGAFGYFAFGDQTRDIITTNLGGGLISEIVQLGLCINLFFTFPIMMNPVFEVVERRAFGKNYCLWARWALVLVVCLVALFVPNFADFLSLVGSSVCCVLGFVLPAAFHLKVFGEQMGWIGITSDIAIVVIGIVFAVSGTWSALLEIFFSKEQIGRL
ncbi:solute carrier family 36 (proton-coupled amino acid transporter) protein [Dioscorea alata]|uniref:Solute carrier family 36 (Proton-coupled amino acid transporter) protein n=1 Tax=Dioscorea alata TaxID=55571 RepID=A0ACB7UU51_DIOAL|nr:solute carrier family 36 (proton-coupled amino acid transporter) protein [Dioscorea alata]